MQYRTSGSVSCGVCKPHPSSSGNWRTLACNSVELGVYVWFRIKLGHFIVLSAVQMDFPTLWLSSKEPVLRESSLMQSCHFFVLPFGKAGDMNIFHRLLNVL